MTRTKKRNYLKAWSPYDDDDDYDHYYYDDNANDEGVNDYNDYYSRRDHR